MLLKELTKEELQLKWKMADCVCLDVDSTVVRDEGIDELAAYCGKGKEVSNLTKAAMSGNISYGESLNQRLSIINASLNQVRGFLRENPPSLTVGVKEFVNKLHSRNVDVYLISGGFRSLISPVAIELNIPLENLFSNRLKFYFDGSYAGVDESEPTAHAGGKNIVIKMLKEKCGYSNLFMIGDGLPDLEACPPADGYIGFGGNVIREAVRERATWFVTSFKELTNAL